MQHRTIARGGMIAAVYAILTIALAPISYGPIQCRVAEALTLLPFFFPEAVFGVTLGCAIANVFGGNGMVDVIVGTAATFVAAMLTRKMPNLWMAALPPVLVNMVAIGAMLHFLIGAPLLLTSVYIGFGEAVACFGVGIPLMLLLKKMGLLKA